VSELDGWQEPGGGGGGAVDGGTLKLSVFEFEFMNVITLGSEPDIEVVPPWATSHALYTPPLFGVVVNGAS